MQQEIELLETIQRRDDLTKAQEDLLMSYIDEGRKKFFDIQKVDLGELSWVMNNVVESWGGEGEGDSIGYVLQFGDRYVSVNGYYNSWDGADYDDADIVEVVPVQKVVTVYERL